MFCRRESVVPEDWKRANVTVIYKEGPKHDAGNYRPISLTVQACKILETIIKDVISEHLVNNRLLKDSQHGFVAKRSCLTNLLSFVDKVCCDVDSGLPVDVIYLDFKKAFDKVPHKRLLTKVKAHGIEGTILSWITNWLCFREQRVVLNGQASKWSKVLSGVPQGSVLGPLLFLIYVNDIDCGLVNTLLKFADDSKLFGCVFDDAKVDSLKSDLIRLCSWSKDWLMPFNVNKCKVMHFGLHNPQTVYNIDGVNLSCVKQERDLGILVQNDLGVSAQCVKAVKTANRMLGLIKRTFACRSARVILPLYKSLVRPHLEYCVQVWCPHLRKDVDIIEAVQHRATKLIEGFHDLTYEQRLHRLDMTSLEIRRVRGDMIEVFKMFKGLDNVAPDKFFALSTNNLRGHCYKLYKKRFSTNIGKYCFSNRVVEMWNGLPGSIVTSSSLKVFKVRLDQYLKHVSGD